MTLPHPLPLPSGNTLLLPSPLVRAFPSLHTLVRRGTAPTPAAQQSAHAHYLAATGRAPAVPPCTFCGHAHPRAPTGERCGMVVSLAARAR